MSIDIVIEPRMRDLGGFTVGRVLPYAKRRTVGPFIFFDEMGPAEFPPGAGIGVAGPDVTTGPGSDGASVL